MIVASRYRLLATGCASLAVCGEGGNGAVMRNWLQGWVLAVLLGGWVCGEAAEGEKAKSGGLKLAGLRNPVMATEDNLRDPSVLKVKDGYLVFYSRFSTGSWGAKQNWAVATVFTRDFARFDDDHDLTPKGFASPGETVLWHGRYVLPYHSYPVAPARLCFSESTDAKTWSAPKYFLDEARDLRWNRLKRLIDPAFVVDGEVLHCFFVGSAMHHDAAGKTVRANLMGHAITRDPRLEQWEILTVDEPMIGVSERAPDGVENLTVAKTGEVWRMIYSEGLAAQHLAMATSKDLRSWTMEGSIEIGKQKWLARKYGASFVWREESEWVMILMGEDEGGRTTFGLLTSSDGREWKLLPE